MVSLFSSVRNTLLSLAFPQKCHRCDTSVDEQRLGVACSACWEKTSLFETSIGLCPKCGAPNPSTDTVNDCGPCVDHRYDTARAMGLYEHAMSASILHLKRLPVIPGVLLERMPRVLHSGNFDDCDLIVPVPLSAKRLAERGFNQAESIAQSVAKILYKPVDGQSLMRKLHTPMHRASMDKKARELSVRNAFDVSRPKLIEGRSILLVDDIFTSGATVSNCAKALKKKGASRVDVFTLARAL